LVNPALRVSLLVAATAFILVAIFAARPVATPGPALRDFEAYWSAGTTWNAHADAYGRPIWNAERRVPGVDRSRDEVLPYVGLAHALPVWGIFARLPYPIAARLWWVVLIVALAALIACVMRACESGIDPLTFCTLALLAIGFGPVTSDLALGQVALVALLGVCVVVVYAARSPLVAILGALLATLQPNVALGLLSQLARPRAVLAMIAAAVIAYFGGALAIGWQWPMVYAKILAAHAGAERFTEIQLSPAAIAYGAGVSVHAATAVGAIVAILTIVAGALMARRIGDAFARFAAFGALAPFVAGFFHEHDLVVAYVAAAWCALRMHGSARAFALAGTLLAAVDWLGLAQRPTGIAQSALLACAAGCAFVALGSAGDLRAMRIPATVAAAVFAAGATLAARHPAPVWPDTLGPFHAAAALPIATVWFDEQHVAGLLAVVPTWSLLRALSLLGCALLAYAIYRHSTYCRTA
jgi:hypothetical protein